MAGQPTIDDVLTSGNLPPIMVLFGEEDYLVEAAARRVMDTLAAADPTGMNTDVVDGESTPLDAILSIARSYPMMHDRRALWVRRFDRVTVRKDRKGTDLLSTYLADPAPATVLLLTARWESADGITAQVQRNAASAERKLAALKFPIGAMLRSVWWQEFPAQREQQVHAWIKATLRREGCTIDADAIDLLTLKAGTSLRDVAMELDKVRLYIDGATTITADDVNTVVGAGRTYSVYDLQRAIGSRDLARSLTIVGSLMTASRQEMLILAMLTRYFVALFTLVDLRTANADRNDMARRAGIPPFALADHFDTIDRYGVAAIERAVLLLADADATLKSTSTDPTTVLTSTLTRLMA